MAQPGASWSGLESASSNQGWGEANKQGPGDEDPGAAWEQAARPMLASEESWGR